jgi:hypothetical protein
MKYSLLSAALLALAVSACKDNAPPPETTAPTVPPAEQPQAPITEPETSIGVGTPAVEGTTQESETVAPALLEEQAPASESGETATK